MTSPRVTVEGKTRGPSAVLDLTSQLSYQPDDGTYRLDLTVDTAGSLSDVFMGFAAGVNGSNAPYCLKGGRSVYSFEFQPGNIPTLYFAPDGTFSSGDRLRVQEWFD